MSRKHTPLEPGTEFGKLTVAGFSRSVPDPKYPGNSYHYYWFDCKCGNRKEILRSQVLRGKTISCGCDRADWYKTHGLSYSSEFSSWSAMKSRCTNPNDHGYHRYGGRGITVCERWNNFENFYADMGPKPSKSYSIERENNSLGYSPENCIWGTRKQQSINRRVVKLYPVQWKDADPDGHLFRDWDAVANSLRSHVQRLGF